MLFEDKRDILLKEALKFTAEGDIKSEFKREFLSLIEKIVINMLDKENSFFGQFLIKIKRDIRLNTTWPIVTVPKEYGFVMYFNPLLFLTYSQKEVVALFKHEIYHIMYGHFEREKELKNKYTTLAINLALDISINEFIKDLPSDSYKLDRVNREFGIDLKKDKPCEVYAAQIEEAIKCKVNDVINEKNKSEVGRIVDISKAHNLWEEGVLNKDELRDITKKTALSSLKGNVPEDIGNIIKQYTEKPEISWQQLLKRLIPSVRCGEKKTITRRSRRQPERIDLRGTLPKNTPEILVAIDISASMSDEEFDKILVEILEITRSRNNKITVIECDNEIRRVYCVKSRSDIKKRLNNTGATKFSPVFRYIKENNLRNHILIYFTDGVGEKELEDKPINSYTIWVLIGDEEFSLENSYGKVKRINFKVEKGEGGNSGLNMYRELQHDWAR